MRIDVRSTTCHKTLSKPSWSPVHTQPDCDGKGVDDDNDERETCLGNIQHCDPYSSHIPTFGPTTEATWKLHAKETTMEHK